MTSPISTRQLRKRAAQARRAASIPTEGDGTVDRDLLQLADQLERQAEAIERDRAPHDARRTG